MTTASLRLLFLAPVLLTTSCNLALFPDSVMYSLGESAYAETTGKYREIVGTPEADMVHRVGERIAKACGKNYAWEFKLLDAPDTVNAFCLPGGKIAVYSGLLPITQNEDALAAVVGHEVAHATQEHGNKRMTQGVLIQVTAAGLQLALDNWSEADQTTKDNILMAFGAGAQYGLQLPYSRYHESEADAIGLRYMVRAGYDPYEAPKLWERMAAAAGESPPPFMSTHPAPLARAEALRQLIPKVLAEERPQ